MGNHILICLCQDAWHLEHPKVSYCKETFWL